MPSQEPHKRKRDRSRWRWRWRLCSDPYNAHVFLLLFPVFVPFFWFLPRLSRVIFSPRLCLRLSFILAGYPRSLTHLSAGNLLVALGYHFAATRGYSFATNVRSLLPCLRKYADNTKKIILFYWSFVPSIHVSSWFHESFGYFLAEQQNNIFRVNVVDYSSCNLSFCSYFGYNFNFLSGRSIFNKDVVL